MAVFMFLNTAALTYSYPPENLKFIVKKKDHLLSHRKHSVPITKVNWLPLFTEMFIVRVIQRNAQMQYVIYFGFLPP